MVAGWSIVRGGIDRFPTKNEQPIRFTSVGLRVADKLNNAIFLGNFESTLN